MFWRLYPGFEGAGLILSIKSTSTSQSQHFISASNQHQFHTYSTQGNIETIKQVIHDFPDLSETLFGLYSCDFKSVFPHTILSLHVKYYRYTEQSPYLQSTENSIVFDFMCDI